MEKSTGRKRKLVKNYECTKSDIHITTKQICNTSSKRQKQNTNNNTTNQQNKYISSGHIHPQICTRTTSKIDIPYSNNDIEHSKKCIMDFPDKHKQQNSEAEHNTTNTTHLKPIQIESNIYIWGNRTNAIPNIQHGRHTIINDSINANRREHETPSTSKSTTSMDIPDNSTDDTYQEPCTYNTFIVHREYTNNNWRSDRISTSKTNQPTFSVFDHGDHFHIVFPKRYRQNNKRTITRVLSWFQAHSAGIAEAYMTIQIKSIASVSHMLQSLKTHFIWSYNGRSNKNVENMMKQIVIKLSTLWTIYRRQKKFKI